MTKTTTPGSLKKPRTKRLKVSKPIVEIDPEASADEAMVLDNAPFTDSLKRISEQARDWEDTALSPRGPKPYERAGRSQNLMLARATVIIGIILFAAILGNAIYFSFQVRTLNRAMTSLTLENKRLKEEVATIAMIKLSHVDVAASEAKAPKVANAPATTTGPTAAPAAAKPATPPATAAAKPATAPAPVVAATPGNHATTAVTPPANKAKPMTAQIKPAAVQTKMAKVKSPTTAWKSDFE